MFRYKQSRRFHMSIGYGIIEIYYIIAEWKIQMTHLYLQVKK